MRILFISHTFPYPPDEGIKLPVYNLLKEFSKNSLITLLTFIEEKQKQYIPLMSKFCKVVAIDKNIKKNLFHRIFFSLTSKLPYNVIQFFNKEFYQVLTQMIKDESYDLIFFDFLTTSYYKKNLNKTIPSVLHYYDAMSMLFYRNFFTERNVFKKFYWYAQYKKLLTYECEMQNWFNKITVVAQKDKDWLCEKAKVDCKKIEVVPNGVDIEYFYFKFDKNYISEPNSLLFRGIMNFKPNVDACLYFLEEIWPVLKHKIPDIKFYIVGPNPTKEILKYANKDKNIVVTGYVEDIREYIARSRVNVCPMISGSGIKNKILESLAMGTPSVITSTAKEGIPELKDAENVLIADTPIEFANKVKKLFEDKDLYNKIAYNGRKLIEEKYTWNRVAERFYKIFEEIISSHNKIVYTN